MLNMSSPTASCCAVVLNQQQQNLHHYHQCAEGVAEKPDKPVVRNCTVVENGRVVVKPLPAGPNQAP